MSPSKSVLLWIAVAIAAFVAISIYPSLFPSQGIMVAIALCGVGWLLWKSRRDTPQSFAKNVSRSKLAFMWGAAFFVAGLAWIFVTLPLIKDTWVEVVFIAFGPAMLLIVAGSVFFGIGVYRLLLRNGAE